MSEPKSTRTYESIVICIAVISIVISMALWTRSDANADRREIHSILHDILRESKEETKDFHTRLALQDANFKADMLRLEEKFKK